MLLRISRLAQITRNRSFSKTLRRPFRPIPLRTFAKMSAPEITYLGQTEAAQLDKDLMGEHRFSIEQLMELAGLSVASAIHQEYSPGDYPRILVIVGPGNNGGDGLVAARHLTLFGHTVQICVPLPTNNLMYNNLHIQCEEMGVRDAMPDIFGENRLNNEFDLIVDAMFGFSFKGKPRPPFDTILQARLSKIRYL